MNDFLSVEDTHHHRQFYFQKRHSVKTESNSPSPDPPFNFSFSSPSTPASSNHSLFTFRSPMSWPPGTNGDNENFDIPSSIHNAISFPDDYDDLVDIPDFHSTLSPSTITGEKIIRRRSSKGIVPCLPQHHPPVTSLSQHSLRSVSQIKVQM